MLNRLRVCRRRASARRARESGAHAVLARVLTASLAALAACTGPQGAPLPPPVGASHDAGQAPLAGGMDEAAFAALHELRTDAQPAPTGRTVALPGVGSNAYLALPADRAAPVPGVIVIHEWWGLNDHIRRWADRLAADGYAALAVDMYEGRVAATREEASSLVKSVKEERAIAILGAANRFLETSPDVLAPKTAALGWCFGGGWSLRAALDHSALDAAVVYYGQPILDRDRLSRLGCPLLAIFGARDGSIPQEKVRALGETLTTLGKAHRVIVYDAEHAFANPSGTRYDSAAAREAWDEVRAFLAAKLR